MATLTEDRPTLDPNLEHLGKPHSRGCIGSFEELKLTLSADLYRYSGHISILEFLKHLVITPGYKYTVFMRTCGYLKTNTFTKILLYPIFKMILIRLRHKYGIAIPEYTLIGPGLFINRFSGVFINGDVIIGANVNITHGTVLGQLNRGARAGSPTIGDNVFLGSRCIIIGAIQVGEGAAVGAGSLVTKDVPPKGVVGGNPAKPLSMDGSGGYINRTVPEDLLERCRRLRLR